MHYPFAVVSDVRYGLRGISNGLCIRQDSSIYKDKTSLYCLLEFMPLAQTEKRRKVKSTTCQRRIQKGERGLEPRSDFKSLIF